MSLEAARNNSDKQPSIAPKSVRLLCGGPSAQPAVPAPPPVDWRPSTGLCTIQVHFVFGTHCILDVIDRRATEYGRLGSRADNPSSLDRSIVDGFEAVL